MIQWLTNIDSTPFPLSWQCHVLPHRTAGFGWRVPLKWTFFSCMGALSPALFCKIFPDPSAWASERGGGVGVETLGAAVMTPQWSERCHGDACHRFEGGSTDVDVSCSAEVRNPQKSKLFKEVLRVGVSEDAHTSEFVHNLRACLCISLARRVGVHPLFVEANFDWNLFKRRCCR